MNKQAAGAVAGPTAAAAAAAAQKQKSLLQRSDNEINSILENFTLLIKAARVNIDPSFRSSQEAFQMEVHATRVVQAADSLLKLVSELKQTAVFSDFASLNKHVEQRVAKFEQQCDETDQLLATVGEEAAASLKELESHYYSSVHRTSD